jgi:hypothetical protein
MKSATGSGTGHVQQKTFRPVVDTLSVGIGPPARYGGCLSQFLLAVCQILARFLTILTQNGNCLLRLTPYPVHPPVEQQRFHDRGMRLGAVKPRFPTSSTTWPIAATPSTRPSPRQRKSGGNNAHRFGARSGQPFAPPYLWSRGEPPAEYDRHLRRLGHGRN